MFTFIQKIKANTNSCSYVTFSSDLYKLTDEVLGQGAYAKVQGCISLQNGQEFAVKVSEHILRNGYLNTVQNVTG